MTAAAAALLYLCFVELGYRRRTATLGSLVFAFATLAWPYSRTFFREPLAMLAYLLAVYGLLRYRPAIPEAAPRSDTPAAPRRYRWLAVAGFALGLAFITKQTGVALAPSLLLLLFAYEWRRPVVPAGDSRLRVWLRISVAFLLPLGLMLALGRVYQAITLGGVEVFARNIVEYTTNPQLSQTVPARMTRAFLGITISPYKGLFWYSPVLLLGLIGAVPFTRRHRWEGVSFLLLIALHLLGYSRYNYWSAGVAWGMRYLLPIVPFLVLLAAPIWSWMIEKPSVQTTRSRWPRWLGIAAIVVLIALSVAIQLIGIAVDLRTYEVRFLVEQAKVWGGIGQAIEALYLKPTYSPVLGHIRLLLAGTEPLDVAWVQHREMGTWAFVPQGLLASLVFVGLALAAFIAIWRRPQWAGRVAVGMALASAVICTGLLVLYRQGDARYDQYGVDRLLQAHGADPRRGALRLARMLWRAPHSGPGFDRLFPELSQRTVGMVRHRTQANRRGADDRFDRAISKAVAGPRSECTDRRPGGPPRGRTLFDGARLQTRRANLRQLGAAAAVLGRRNCGGGHNPAPVARRYDPRTDPTRYRAPSGR